MWDEVSTDGSLGNPQEARSEPSIQENKPSASLLSWRESQPNLGVAHQAGSLSGLLRLTRPRAKAGKKQPSLPPPPPTTDSREEPP